MAVPPSPLAVLFRLIVCILTPQHSTAWAEPGRTPAGCHCYLPDLALYVNTESEQCDQVYPFLFWFQSYLVFQYDRHIDNLTTRTFLHWSPGRHTWGHEIGRNEKIQKLKFLITGWRVPGGVSRAGYKYGNIPGWYQNTKPATSDKKSNH